jgi:LSD1 subclass zinc finger protein
VEAQVQAGAPEALVRNVACKSCGAKLSFAPGTRMLKCGHCGAENEIAPDASASVAEQDFDAELAALEGKAETYEEEHVKCEGCGAEQTLPKDLFAGRCAFCGAPIVEKGYAKRLVKPEALVPFQVDRARAQDNFRNWVRRRWLAPGDLKRYAQSDSGLAGMYVPYWTFDCRTSSDYRGERGDDYYTTETYTTRNAQGEEVVQTRQVRQTRWTAAAGHVDAFHDDVLVTGSSGMPGDVLGALGHWDLKALVPYQPEFVSGFQAVAYRVGLRDAFVVARQEIDGRVEQLVRRDIGGDHQRIQDVATRYSDITFKNILLPVWTSAYRYRDKAYRFTVNAQTGEVTGESPYSWWKIALIAVAVVAVVFLLLVYGSKN